MNSTSLVEAVEISKPDQADLEKKLETLKALDFTNASVSVYVVKISTTNKLRRCTDAKLLQCVPSLQNQFQNFVSSSIETNNHITAFTEISTNQDNRFFHVGTSETDFIQVLSMLHPSEEQEDIKPVTKLGELGEFNAYVIEIYLSADSPPIYGFRYVSQAWNPRNSAGGFFRLNDDMVALIDATPTFRIDSQLDFIAYGDDTFIINSSKFEAAMQFKERLVERKAATVDELGFSGIFAEGDELTLDNAIGTDKHLLRQLSSVREKAHYKDPNWIKSLKAEAQAAGNWMLEFDATEKIVIKKEKLYVRELLIVLQNKRVQTVIDKKIYDVDGELTAQVTR